MRLVTFNIRTSAALGDKRNHWIFRRAALTDAVLELDADIIALQEVRPRALRYMRKRLRGYRCLSTGRNSGHGGEACPIFVGSSLKVLGFETRWFSETPAVPGSRFAGATHPRICSVAHLVDVAGQKFVVANVHLDAINDDFRGRSLALLHEWAAADGVPWILVGDFNCVIDAPEMSAVADYRDALVDVSGATFHGFTGSDDGPRIDHVLLPPLFVVDDARIVNDVNVSDHFPIIVQLTLAR